MKENISGTAKPSELDGKKDTKLKQLERFIYFHCRNVVLAILKPFKWIRLIHEKIKQTDIEEIKFEKRTAYQLLFEWIIEIIQYGFLLAIVYADIFIINGWQKWALFPFCLGIIRWLWIDIVENTSQAIKNK